MEGVFRRVDAVMVPVPLDTGMAFYRDGLGHRLLWRNDAIGEAGLALADSATEIVLSVGRDYSPNWLVDSAEDAARRIVEAGGSMVVEPFDIPVGRVAVVSDPFGNPLVLVDLTKGRYAVDAAGEIVCVVPTAPEPDGE